MTETNGLRKKGATGMPEKIVAAVYKLDNPNMSPTKAPVSGPSSTAAMITGICMVVMENGGIGIYPREGMSVRTMVNAEKIPATAIRLTLTRGLV